MSLTTQAISARQVRLISHYLDQSDYGVYIRRLNRDVRVCRNLLTDELLPMTAEVTPEEQAACFAAVREYLAIEHAKYLEWAKAKGFAVEEG